MKKLSSIFRFLLIALFISGYSALTGAQQSGTPGEKFSMVMLPDAQNYTSSLFGGSPSTFTAQTQWCVNNQAAMNISYVGMLGDLTNFSMSWEWTYANNAMSVLDAVLPGIPFGVVPGNHDLIFGASTYNSYFGVSRFQGRSYYGGHYGSTNENHYDFFSSGGMDFIVICVGSGDQVPSAGVLDWADALLKINMNKRGILINHSLMYAGIQGSFTPPGQAIYNALKDNQNLFMMICGHEFGSGYRTDSYNGNTIYTMIADYQDEPNGGNGWLRIAEFDPPNNVIHMTTYSPTLRTWKTSGNDQFDIQYNMQSGLLPLAFNVTGSGSYCQGTGGLPVGLSGSQAGVTYTLYKDGLSQYQSVAGTGNPISFGTRTAGVYTVKAANTAGTTDMAGNATIIENPSGGLSVVVAPVNANCPGGTGSTTFTFSGGTEPFSVKIGANTYSGTSPMTINLSTGGSFNYIATDKYACTQLTGSFMITIPEPIVISGTVTNASSGMNDGAIAITVSGGTLPVTGYSWTGSGYQAVTQNISGLTAGTYMVTVTDSKSCTATKSFEVQNASPPEIVSVSASNNGTVFRTSLPYTTSEPVIYITGATGNFGLPSRVIITVAATGGSGALTYSWSPSTGLSSSTGAQVTASPSTTTDYTVSVTDSKGSTVKRTQTVTVNNITCIVSRKPGVKMCMVKRGVYTSSCVLLSNTKVINDINNLFGYCSGTANVSAGSLMMEESTELTANASIKAYPNPTTGNIRLEVKGFGEGKARVNLFSSDGKLSMQKDLVLTGDEQLLPLDLSELSNGIYLLQLVFEQGSRQITIIKQ